MAIQNHGRGPRNTRAGAVVTLYRALYQTRSGQSRRMTFSHSGGIKAAHSFAQAWEQRDDKLLAVVTVRALERPAFQLQAQLTGV